MQCIACQNNFDILEGDQKLYDKLGVPAPKRCPKCRFQLVLSYRNKRVIFQQPCDLCQKNIITSYHPDCGYSIYCPDCFYSDTWDQHASGVDFDFSRSFFEQYKELDQRAPKLGTITLATNENSDYTNYSAGNKDCYLIFAAVGNQECYYGDSIRKSKNTVDFFSIKKDEWCYEITNTRQCNDLIYAESCFTCASSAFLYDCRSCTDCFMCSNLRQKKYCIRNKQHTPEEYKAFMDQINLGSYLEFEAFANEYKEMKVNSFRRCEQTHNEDVVGSRIYNSTRCYYCFDATTLEDCRYASNCDNCKDCSDIFAAYRMTELCYYGFGFGLDSYANHWSILTAGSSFVVHSMVCHNSQYCFGSNNLRNAKYCIFNKKFDEEGYHEQVSKIQDHMKETGEYGTFFPPSLSPYAYNESTASDYFPLEKSELEKQGWMWRDKDEREYLPQTLELPDSVQETQESVTNEMLACVDCGKNYKIIAQELEFYRNMLLPIPRKCPECRMQRRFHSINPWGIWERDCDKCSMKFESSYSPEREETVYCTNCYQESVY